MNGGNINCKWLSITLMVGAGSLVAGVSIGDWSRDSISGLLIEIGGGAVLFAIGIIIQPLIFRKISTVTEAVAAASARRATDDLSHRISRLEDITKEQELGQQRREDEINEALTNLRADVSVESLGRALMKAFEYRLLSAGGFRVRTSDSLKGPELYFLPLVDPGKVVFVWMSFFPMRLVPQEFRGKIMNVPENRDGVVLWAIGKESAGEIAAQLQGELIKMNHPGVSEFSFSYGIERLIQSIEVMFRSRSAPYGSGYKLDGALIVLINGEWVLTEAGLESIHLSTVVEYSSLRDNGGDSLCPTEASPSLWQEASQYVLH